MGKYCSQFLQVGLVFVASDNSSASGTGGHTTCQRWTTSCRSAVSVPRITLTPRVLRCRPVVRNLLTSCSAGKWLRMLHPDHSDWYAICLKQSHVLLLHSFYIICWSSWVLLSFIHSHAFVWFRSLFCGSRGEGRLRPWRRRHFLILMSFCVFFLCKNTGICVSKLFLFEKLCLIFVNLTNWE